MIFNNKRDEDPMRDLPGSAAPARATVADTVGKPQARSLIDTCLVVNGSLRGEGELHIDGWVQGDIRCTRLTVGREATVDGNVAAEEVIVRGKVKGVIGGNRVILMDSARVESDIFHKRLSVEEGAEFDGVAHYRENPLETLQAAPAQPKAAAGGAEPSDHEGQSIGASAPPTI